MTPVRVFALVLFFVLMLPIACVPTTAGPEPSIDQNTLSNTTTSYPAPTAGLPDNEPIPSKELDSYPAPVPTKDQQPVVTPWPSPVREEQPTPTALPLRLPSDNISGNLYLVGSKDNSTSELYAVPVNYDSTVVLEAQHKLPEV